MRYDFFCVKKRNKIKDVYFTEQEEKDTHINISSQSEIICSRLKRFMVSSVKFFSSFRLRIKRVKVFVCEFKTHLFFRFERSR